MRTHLKLDKKLDGDRRWRNLLGTEILTYFKNLRDLRRFLNTLVFTVGLFESDNDAFEVNPVDLVTLEIIRFFEPDVYSRLSNLKNILTTSKIYHTFNESQEEEVRTSLKHLLDLAKPQQRSILREVIRDLFPECAWALYEDKRHGLIGNIDRSEALRDLRVCQPSLFDRYFQSTVPQHDMPQADLNRLVVATSDSTKFLTLLRELSGRNLLDLALERFAAYTSEVKSDDVAGVVKLKSVRFSGQFIDVRYFSFCV